MLKFDNENILISNIKKLNYKDLVIFLIPFCIFMYYLHVFNPGILSYDSFNQIHQITTNDFYNWHPFFHTFIEMLCFKVYASPISVGIMQISVFSIIWMALCKYNRAEENQKLFIVQCLITLVISLIPINGIFSITLMKDILFSYLLLLFCFLIEVLWDNDFDVSYAFVFILALTMAFICQLRPNGLILVFVSLIFLAILLFKKNSDKKLYIIIPALVIIFIFLISSLNMAYDVKDNQKDVFLDKTVHILAYYDLNGDISHEDHEKIYKLISKEDIKDNFNIYFTDPTYKVSNKHAFKEHKMDYIKLAVKYSLKNPLDFIEYVLKSSSMVWNISKGDGEGWIVYRTDIETPREHFYKARNTQPVSDLDNASAKNLGTSSYYNLNSYASMFRDTPILDTLFNNPAFYMYMAFVVLAILYYITKSYGVFLIYLPNFLSALIVMLSTPIQSYRYLYGNLLVFYLLLIILARYLLTKDKSSNTGIQ